MLYARSLGPGQPNPSIKQRWKAGTKPKLHHLRDEVMRRAPDRRSSNWTADQCFAFLVANRAPQPGSQPSASGTPQELPKDAAVRWVRA